MRFKDNKYSNVEFKSVDIVLKGMVLLVPRSIK